MQYKAILTTYLKGSFISKILFIEIL